MDAESAEAAAREPCPAPGTQRVAIGWLGRNVNLGRRAAQLVELLDRRFEHVAFARSDNRILGPQLHALDDAAAADLKDLERDAGRAELQAEHVAVAELGG